MAKKPVRGYQREDGTKVGDYKREQPKSGPRRGADPNVAAAAAAAEQSAAESRAAAEELVAYRRALPERMRGAVADIREVAESVIEYDRSQWDNALEDTDWSDHEIEREGHVDGLVEDRFEEEHDKAVEWTEWVLAAALELSNSRWDQSTVLREVGREADEFVNDSNIDAPYWAYVVVDQDKLAEEAERLVAKHDLGGGHHTIWRSDILSALQQTDMPEKDEIVLNESDPVIRDEAA